MSEFKRGQRVHVEFDGVVTAEGNTGVYVKPDGKYLGVGWVPDVTVTPLEPPSWPPQVGDIWEADGREWFARINLDHKNKTVMVSEIGRLHFNLDTFKALNPALVRRRGQLWDSASLSPTRAS